MSTHLLLDSKGHFSNCEWKDNFYSHHPCFQLLRIKKNSDRLLNIEKHEYMEKVYNLDVKKVGKFVRENYPPDTNDEVFMKKLVLVKGRLIRYASDRLKDDKMFILELVKKKQVVFIYASERLRADREVFEAALDLRECGNDLFRILERIDISDGPELGIVNLFKKSTRLFKYCTSNQLRTDQNLKQLVRYDRDLIKQAAQHHGRVLSYVGREFSQDPEIILAALGTYIELISLLPSHLKKNTDFALKVASKYPYSFYSFYCDQDEEFWYKAVIEYKYLKPNLPPRLFQSRELLKITLAKRGFLLELLSDEDRNDIELVSCALNDLKNIKFVPEKLRNSEKVVSLICGLFIPHEYLLNVEYSIAGQHVYLKNNMGFMKWCCLGRFNNPLLFKHASPELRGNIEFIKCIIKACLLQKLDLKKVRENVILNILGKKEDRDELVELHNQCKAENPYQKLLFFACPLLFFDENFVRKESLHLISTDYSIEKLFAQAFKKREIMLCAACSLIEPSLYSVENGNESYHYTSSFFHYMEERHFEIIYSECNAWQHQSKYILLPQQTKDKIAKTLFERTRGISSSLEHVCWDNLTDLELISGLEKFFFRGFDSVEEYTRNLIGESFRKRFGNDRKFFKTFLVSLKLLPFLQYASDEIKDDLDFFLALSHLPKCIQYSSERLRSNKEFVKKIVSKDYTLFEYASETIRNDYDFVLELIQELHDLHRYYNWPSMFHLASRDVRIRLLQCETTLMDRIIT